MNAAVKLVDGVLYDIQPQAGAFAAFGGPEKHIENLRQEFFGDAGAIITERDLSMCIGYRSTNVYTAGRFIDIAVFDGIGNQVIQDDRKPVNIRIKRCG